MAGAYNILMNESHLKDEARAFVYWMSGSLHLAEELADEAFFRAGRLPALLGELSPGPCLEPFPDAFFPQLPEPEPGQGPIRRFEARESVSFAFLSALQTIPAQARAALVLRDVMGRDAGETAGILGLSGSNLEDLLECARDALGAAYDPAAGRREPPPDEKAARLMLGHIFEREKTGRWRLLPRRANGQLAFGVYELDGESRMFKAHSLQVILFEEEAVAEVVSFADPLLFPSFDLLPEIFAQG